jgi:hypothetical protein
MRWERLKAKRPIDDLFDFAAAMQLETAATNSQTQQMPVLCNQASRTKQKLPTLLS